MTHPTADAIIISLGPIETVTRLIQAQRVATLLQYRNQPFAHWMALVAAAKLNLHWQANIVRNETEAWRVREQLIALQTNRIPTQNPGTLKKNRTSPKRKPATHPDLFETEATPIIEPASGAIQKIRSEIGLRTKIGPKGERCKSCQFLRVIESESGRRFFKCAWIGTTMSSYTDVRLYYSCRKYLKVVSKEGTGIP